MKNLDLLFSGKRQSLIVKENIRHLEEEGVIGSDESRVLRVISSFFEVSLEALESMTSMLTLTIEEIYTCIENCIEHGLIDRVNEGESISFHISEYLEKDLTRAYHNMKEAISLLVDSVKIVGIPDALDQANSILRNISNESEENISAVRRVIELKLA